MALWTVDPGLPLLLESQARSSQEPRAKSPEDPKFWAKKEFSCCVLCCVLLGKCPHIRMWIPRIEELNVWVEWNVGKTVTLAFILSKRSYCSFNSVCKRSREPLLLIRSQICAPSSLETSICPLSIRIARSTYVNAVFSWRSLVAWLLHWPDGRISIRFISACGFYQRRHLAADIWGGWWLMPR